MFDNQPAKNVQYQENICHKIIDAFKIEDLMRAFECKIDYVNSYLLKYIPEEDIRKKMEIQYATVIAEMIDSNVTQVGHTARTLKLINTLKQFVKEESANLPNHDRYFEKAKPFIDDHKKRAKNEHFDNIDICLNANYGLLLLKLDKSPITPEMEKAVQAMGQYLAYLGNAHNAYLAKN